MVTPPATGVLIVAPTALHRAAWAALLAQQPDVRVAGALADPTQLTLLVSSGAPTAVLLDLSPPLPDAVQQWHAICATCGILVLVPSYDPGAILPLLQAGAMGCLSRDESVGNLARALIAVGRGELVLPPAIAARALAALAHGEPVEDVPAEPLSERELEVLRLLARGLTNKDIAQTLIVSVRTVEAHLRSIFAKLEVRSRTEAALWAVQHGYGAEQ